MRFILVSVERLLEDASDKAVDVGVSKAMAEEVGGDSPITHPS